MTKIETNGIKPTNTISNNTTNKIQLNNIENPSYMSKLSSDSVKENKEIETKNSSTTNLIKDVNNGASKKVITIPLKKTDTIDLKKVDNINKLSPKNNMNINLKDLKPDSKMGMNISPRVTGQAGVVFKLPTTQMGNISPRVVESIKLTSKLTTNYKSPTSGGMKLLKDTSNGKISTRTDTKK